MQTANFQVTISGNVKTVHFASYGNGALAVQLFDEEGPYATLSVNIDGSEQLPEDEFVLSHDIPDTMVKDLVDQGAVEDTGKRASYGFVEDQPVMRWTGRAL